MKYSMEDKSSIFKNLEEKQLECENTPITKHNVQKNKFKLSLMALAEQTEGYLHRTLITSASARHLCGRGGVVRPRLISLSYEVNVNRCGGLAAVGGAPCAAFSLTFNFGRDKNPSLLRLMMQGPAGMTQSRSSLPWRLVERNQVVLHV